MGFFSLWWGKEVKWKGQPSHQKQVIITKIMASSRHVQIDRLIFHCLWQERSIRSSFLGDNSRPQTCLQHHYTGFLTQYYITVLHYTIHISLIQGGKHTLNKSAILIFVGKLILANSFNLDDFQKLIFFLRLFYYTVIFKNASRCLWHLVKKQ